MGEFYYAWCPGVKKLLMGDNSWSAANTGILGKFGEFVSVVFAVGQVSRLGFECLGLRIADVSQILPVKSNFDFIGVIVR